jgi:hypothetical protein
MNDPIKSEFQFIEQPDSKLKIAYEHEVIPVDFDYARHLQKGDCIWFLENPPQSSLKPEFWLGAEQAFQNIQGERFIVVKRVHMVETDHHGLGRNILRIVLEQESMRNV